MSSPEMSLKYDLLNSQMNPHFINNAIQSICNSITKGNIQQSINWLNRLSCLYRLVQKSTKEKLITLEEELQISTLYVELQQDLFEKGFSYRITIDETLKEDVSFTKVPPLIFQPLIENAIIHGLKSMKKNGKGELQIVITSDESTLHVCVLDNGEGISTSKSNQHTASGISLENINERLQIINGETSDQKLLRVETMKNHEGLILGTQSCLRIPLIQI